MTKFNILGRIELSFTNRGWFKFFGVEVQPVFCRDESASLGHYLSRLDNSTELTIRFRDPQDGIVGDPWGGEMDYDRTSCQKFSHYFGFHYEDEDGAKGKEVEESEAAPEPDAERGFAGDAPDTPSLNSDVADQDWGAENTTLTTQW